MQDLQLGTTFYPGETYGATVAAPLWKEIMDSVSVNLPVLDFTDPSGQAQPSNLVLIPNVAGMTVSQAMTTLTAAQFTPEIGGAVSSSYPAGRVVGTQPSAQAPLGTTIVITTSARTVPSPTTAPPTTAQPETTSPTTPTPRATTPRATTPTPPPGLPRCRPGGHRPCRK